MASSKHPIKTAISWLLKYLPPFLNIVAVSGVAITSVWLGTWLSLRFAGVPAQSAASAAVAPIREVRPNLFNLATPVPYFWGSVVATIIFSLEGIRNRYLYGESVRLQDELRDEHQQHGTTKRSYYDSLSSALRFLLSPPNVGFTNCCRVTIYRQDENDAERLRKIFRYSENNIYSDGGRFSIPSDEGLVGLAWTTGAVVEFRPGPGRSVERYLQQQAGKTVSALELSMQARVFWAKRIDDHDTGKRVGVIIYESTDDQCLNFDEIVQINANNAATIERFVKHLARLDSAFNPEGRPT